MRSHWLVSTAVAAVMLTPAVALAQSDAPAQGAVVGLEEIVVTAQRVEENLQRAALAISAVSADDLQRAGVTDVTQLTQLTPALQIGGLFGPYPALYIRGVGNFSTNSQSDPAVAFSVDGVYFARQNSLGGTFFDLERVEILKGPQGTLYGRNATGGAINVITAKPRMGEYSGRVMAEVGNYDSTKFEGAINVPLMENVAARVAAQSIRHDGYYSDGTGNENTTSVRAQLAADPTDSIHLNFGVDYSKQKGVAGATVVGLNFEDRIGVSDPRAQAIYSRQVSFLAGTALQGLQNTWYTNNEFTGIYMQADIQTPLGTLTILPAYRRGELDFSAASQFTITQLETDKQKSLEIRLASDNDRTLRYLAGLYYFDETTDAHTQFNQSLFAGHAGSLIDTTSYAAFGRLTWAVTDRLRLTGGVRYTKDEKTGFLRGANLQIICPGTLAVIQGRATVPNFCFGTPGLPNSVNIPAQFLNPDGTVRPVTPYGNGAIVTGAPYSFRPSKDFSKTTWRGAVEYDLAPDSLLYASVETGFKSGGFFATLDNPVYAPETITAYTIGSKNRLLDNRLQLNAEFFYWKYNDQQYSHLKTNSRGGFDFVTENIGESIYKGVDLEIQFLATQNTLLTANVQYLDANNEEFVFNNPAALGPPNVGCPFSPVPVNGFFVVNCSNKTPPKSPEWTASLGIQQTIPLASGAKVVLDAHTNYQSEILAGQDYLPQQFQDSYWISDLQISYTDPEDRYELSAFVNNVTDEAVAGNVNVHPQAGQIFGASLRPPRTYGARVSAKF